MRTVIAFAFSILAGCTGQDVYRFGQSIGESKADCEALVSFDERQACEAGFARDFETYQKQRAMLGENDG